jgi:hypothetical protein
LQARIAGHRANLRAVSQWREPLSGSRRFRPIGSATRRAGSHERATRGRGADIGFDFIRLRVSLAPRTDTGSTADQQRGLTLANGITQQALAYGMRVDVVMMAGSLSTTTAAGLICLPIPPRSPLGQRDGKRYSLSFQIPSMLPSSP